MNKSGELQQFKSIFISDIHIGTREAHLTSLANFIRDAKTENLFLVGDIVDLWMGKRLKLSPEALRLIRKFIKKAQLGTKVVYIPGNHDEIIRTLSGYNQNNLMIADSFVYTSVTGKNLLIVHGDLFDPIVLHCRWLSYLGATAYDIIVWVNHWYRRFCTKIKIKPKSFASYIRTKVKSAASFIANFEGVLIQEAKQHNLDGVIAGHIHTPSIKEIDGMFYANCGDWLEHCSLIVEHLDGKFEIIILPY